MGKNKEVKEQGAKEPEAVKMSRCLDCGGKGSFDGGEVVCLSCKGKGVK